MGRAAATLFAVGFAVVGCTASSLSLSGRLALPVAASKTDATRAIANTRVTLNGGEYSTVTSADGSFTFFNVSAGPIVAATGKPSGRVYLCEIDSSSMGQLVWPTYKFNVPSSDAADVAVVEYRYPGAPKIPATHPVTAFPVAQAVYFEERPKTTFWSILKNPQVLMMLVMGSLLLCMPALQKNMDPQARAEMEAQQAMMSDPASALKALFGGGEAAAPAPAPAPTPARSIANDDRKKKAKAS